MIFHADVQSFHADVQSFHADVQLLHAGVQLLHAGVQLFHADVQLLHTGVQLFHAGVQLLHAGVIVKERMNNTGELGHISWLRWPNIIGELIVQIVILSGQPCIGFVAVAYLFSTQDACYLNCTVDVPLNQNSNV